MPTKTPTDGMWAQACALIDDAERMHRQFFRLAASGMPAEVKKQARKELQRLERMPEGAGEYSMIRTYLDWLIELPWATGAEAAIDIAEARRILDEDHYGLDKIKKRILEYLAVRKPNPSRRKSAVTGARTSGRCPATSSRACAIRARATAC